MKLEQLQLEINARWGSASYIPHVDQDDHAILHLMKALGKIAASIEQTHHINGDVIGVRSQIADLVICSSRLASLREIDLEEAVRNRLAEKFPPQKK